jgi:hypothetical protein
MRKSIDGLSRDRPDELAKDAYSGHLFVFVSRRQDRLKILLWDIARWPARQATCLSQPHRDNVARLHARSRQNAHSQRPCRSTGPPSSACTPRRTAFPGTWSSPSRPRRTTGRGHNYAGAGGGDVKQLEHLHGNGEVVRVRRLDLPLLHTDRPLRLDCRRRGPSVIPSHAGPDAPPDSARSRARARHPPKPEGTSAPPRSPRAS